MEKEKKVENRQSSPLYTFVNRLGTITIALVILSMGLDMDRVFRFVVLGIGGTLSALSLIFIIFERRLTKPGDELTAKIIRRAEANCFGTFPLFLFIVFMVCIIGAEATGKTLNEFATAGTIMGLVSVSYIAHVFLYGLMIYIPLKKAGKESGTQDEN